MADVTRTIEIEVLTKDAVKGIDDLNKSLDENQEEVEDTKEETKKYEKQLEDTSKVTGAFTTQMDKMTGGMFSTVKGILSSVKALKSLRVALIATGLGAFLVVVGAVVTAFTRLEGPMRKIEELLGGLEGVVGIIGDRFAFLGLAISDLLTGDLAGALENWHATWSGISEEMDKAYQTGVLLARQIRENSVNESARNAQIAKNNRELERQLQITRDFNQSFEVRKAALEETFKIQNENLELTRKNAEEALTIAKNQFDLSPAGPTGKKTAAATIELNNAIEQYNSRILLVEKQRRELLNRRFEQLTKEEGAQKRITTEIEKQVELTEELDDNIEDTDEAWDRILETAGQTTDEWSEFNKGAEEATKNIELLADATKEEEETQNDLNTALGVTADAAKGVLDIFQGKVQGKDIFKTVLKTLGSVLNIVLPGAGAVTGLIGGLFADGGYTGRGGKYEPAGIVHKGEYVVPQKVLNSSFGSELVNQLESMRTGLKGYSDGGFVAGLTAQEAQISQLNQTLSEQRIVLPIEDLRTVNTRVTTIEDRATL